MTNPTPAASPPPDAVVQQGAIAILRYHRVEVVPEVWEETLKSQLRPDVKAKQIAYRYLAFLMEHLYGCDNPVPE